MMMRVLTWIKTMRKGKKNKKKVKMRQRIGMIAPNKLIMINW